MLACPQLVLKMELVLRELEKIIEEILSPKGSAEDPFKL